MNPARLPNGWVRLDLPPAIARDLARRLARDVMNDARLAGVRIPASTIALLDALDAAMAAQPPSSFERTDSGGSSTLELSVADAAERLECSCRWVQILARRGVITGRRIGRTWLLDAATVERYRRGTAA